MNLKKQLLVTAAVGGLFIAAVSTRSQNWTLTGAPDSGWSAVASSADGNKLVAASFVFNTNGGIYVSTNSGASWTLTGAPLLNWGCLASSADGVKLVAGVGVAAVTGPVFTSTNSGMAWGQAQAPDINWWSMASSEDGSRLAAVSGNDLLSSTDSGATWVKKPAPPGYIWRGVASSADGSQLLVVGMPTQSVPIDTNNFAYLSTNSGTTWSRRNIPAPELMNWGAVASSADGTRLVAAGDSGYGVYVSADSGGTWATSVPATNTQVSHDISVASSADGTKLVEAVYYEGIYLSTNSGATWALTTDTPRGWTSVAASADGNKLIATVEGGGIYRWQSTPAPVLDISALDGQLDISWIVPSMNFTLQRISDLSMTNWVDVTTTPTMTNLYYHVVLPLPASNTCYRLASS